MKGLLKEEDFQRRCGQNTSQCDSHRSFGCNRNSKFRDGRAYPAVVYGVFLFQRKTHVGVALKVLLMEGAALDHLLGERPLQIHEAPQHLIVGLTREQDLAGEELIDHTANTPNVHGVVCKHTPGFGHESGCVASCEENLGNG